MKGILGGFFIFSGLIMIAGSAGDCDGACMDQANTIGEMLTIAGIGLVMFATGALIAIKEMAND